MDLLSLEDFKTFAHSKMYTAKGKRPPKHTWPSETILFYRLIGPDKHTLWQRARSLKMHAEMKMMKDKDLKPESLPYATYTLEMVLSNSPCKKCSSKLIELKDKFKSSGKNLRITIRISSFHKTYEHADMDGLVNLVREKIVLKIFDGDPDWTEFLRDVIDGPEEYFSELLAVALKEERRAREYIDRCILKDIYSCYRRDISAEDFCEMVDNPSNAREIKKRRKGKKRDNGGGTRM